MNTEKNLSTINNDKTGSLYISEETIDSNDSEKKVDIRYAEPTITTYESNDRDALKITVPRELLQEIDDFCQAFNLTKSNFITTCINEQFIFRDALKSLKKLWWQKLYFYKYIEGNIQNIEHGLQQGANTCIVCINTLNSPSTALFCNLIIDEYSIKDGYLDVCVTGAEYNNNLITIYDHAYNKSDQSLFGFKKSQVDRSSNQLITPTFLSPQYETVSISYRIPLEYIWRVEVNHSL